MFLHVFLYITCLGTGIAAYLAFVRAIHGMCHLMFLQLVSCGECKVTIVALVKFITAMQFHVCINVAFLTGSIIAFVALERFLPFMYIHV